jgi:hypothetical protein
LNGERDRLHDSCAVPEAGEASSFPRRRRRFDQGKIGDRAVVPPGDGAAEAAHNLRAKRPRPLNAPVVAHFFGIARARRFVVLALATDNVLRLYAICNVAQLAGSAASSVPISSKCHGIATSSAVQKPKAHQGAWA